MTDLEGANRRWATMLARLAIPDDIVASAEAPPYFFDPEVFVDAANAAVARSEDTPSDRLAREALPTGGTVLDVACGAGAASLRLRPGQLVGIDPSRPLLAALEEHSARLGIDATTVEGTWPELANDASIADVVVCHHVVYNVANLAAFAAALDQRCRRRVVVELTAEHPMAWMRPLWEALYGLEPPTRPVAEDAIAVLRELGFRVREQRWQRQYQMIGETGEHAVERLARRLCLPATRHQELRDLLMVAPPPTQRDVVTLSWEPTRAVTI